MSMAMNVSTEMTNLFDSYSRQARLFPGLLTIFPPLLAILAWFPWLILSSVMASLLTLAMSCGLLYGLASYTRTKGRRVEAKLIKKWGGWPSTLLLRHSSSLDTYTRKRYHDFLEAALPSMVFPGPEQEKYHPKEADDVYASAVKWLIERTRSSKDFPMLFRENVQYGFRRNLLGLKPMAIFLCIMTCAVSFLAVTYSSDNIINALKSLDWRAAIVILDGYGAAVISAVVINLVAVPVWIFLVTKKWVQEAGFQYAAALLACCDKISLERPL